MSGDGGFRAAALDEAVVAITGGTSGSGLAAAEMLARAGARRLFVTGRDAQRGEQALAALRQAGPGTEVQFVQGDVADPDSAARLAAAVRDAGDGLDAVVTCAGGNHPPTLFHDTDAAAARAIVDQWLMGTILTLQAVLPLIRAQGGGAVVTVASDAGKVATPGEAVIGAAMSAIMMLSRTLALENARHGIRVNCITPSLIAGTLTYDLVMADSFGQRLFDRAVDRARLGLATPEDQAALICFLIGPAARRMTGQTISVNGGISAA